MKLSREARRTARELFSLAVVNGRVDAGRLRLIADRVAEAKPRAYLQILKEITRLTRIDMIEHHALIESAGELSAAEAAALAEALRARFGDITSELRVNPSLIGGVRVQVGSSVWDGSIRARIEALQNQL